MYKGLPNLEAYKYGAPCHCKGVVQGADSDCAAHGLSAVAELRKNTWEKAVNASSMITRHLAESTLGENHKIAVEDLEAYKLDIASDIYRQFLNEDPTLAQIESSMM